MLQNKGGYKSSFKLFEGFLAVLVKNEKDVGLGKAYQRFGDHPIVLDEAAVEVTKF